VQARDAVSRRSWSHPQEPTGEGESEWERLKAAAKEFWSQYGDLRNVNVGVMFKGRVPGRRDHRAFIEEVAAVVRQRLAKLRPENQNFVPTASLL
jgi:hypothetical protein